MHGIAGEEFLGIKLLFPAALRHSQLAGRDAGRDAGQGRDAEMRDETTPNEQKQRPMGDFPHRPS
jgi:hypothetical protein